MQFFWLYMDELLGKGFGIWTILKLLFYMSSTMVPLALPLGILLASIMTFGNMGEAFELVAIKSSGISLLRFMRPLLCTICIIAAGAFFFNNNVIPVANLKAFSLLYDLRNAKMSLNIRPGQFNHDIPGYALKIGEKDKDDKTIRDIIIYDGSGFNGNSKIVMAKSGEMNPSADGKFIVFRLRDGWRYEEGEDNAAGNTYGAHATQMRMHFASYDKIIDLSSLKLSRTNEDLFKTGYQMMNWKQLLTDMDQIRKTQQHDLLSGESNFVSYLPVYNKATIGKDFRKKLEATPVVQKSSTTKQDFTPLSDSLNNRAVETALSNVKNAMQLIGYTAVNVKNQNENLIKRDIAFHSKFTLSFACVLLFLIGAPLGAIIRKGGLGLPIVAGIAFFVLYFIISKVGEQLSQSGILPAYFGMWLSTIMLFPIALFMIRQARNDSPLFSKEWYLRRWTGVLNMFGVFKKPSKSVS